MVTILILSAGLTFSVTNMILYRIHIVRDYECSVLNTHEKQRLVTFLGSIYVLNTWFIIYKSVLRAPLSVLIRCISNYGFYCFKNML